MAKFVITLATIFLVLDKAYTQIFDINETLQKLPEEAKLNFTQLSTKYAATAESHTVITVDGYVLTLFHIPGDKTRPVLLAHGILGAADIYIDRGNTSLIAGLYREGYDIWVLNVRGNRYSRKHLYLDPDMDKTFWDFSIHEHGNYDLSANIDYVLNATGQKKLSLIGISQGTTIAFILGACQPEYNKKIKVFIALAPVVFLSNLPQPSSLLIKLSSEINELVTALNQEELFGYNSALKGLYNIICSQTFGYDICLRLGMFLITGDDAEQFEPDFYKITIGRFPDGTSRKNIAHYAQIGKRRSFSQYDYGSENVVIYNSRVPPNYNLKKFTVDTVFISGKNDKLSTLKDLELLKRKLPNVVAAKVLKPINFNHFDHVWGRDTHHFSYPFVYSILDKYNRKILPVL
ncbi:hypothetical protein K1T71_008041 [Dendrolimus kikuchii]|uniref:Uncharacterized protein n=1 Tax=Dendrolimus kikuchii TaxID=765133 RepID=A0ACC1CZZ1_9NEOP|nr:hypothetical protein K1T71_008041 [Dendrolimus kikuchii]